MVLKVMKMVEVATVVLGRMQKALFVIMCGREARGQCRTVSRVFQFQLYCRCCRLLILADVEAELHYNWRRRDELFAFFASRLAGPSHGNGEGCSEGKRRGLYCNDVACSLVETGDKGGRN